MSNPIRAPMPQERIRALIRAIPKAELHLHIEGTLEPELMFQLASENRIALPFASVDDVRKAYDFTDLQSFLDIYYAGTRVLIAEADFYRLTWAYLARAASQNVRHAEIFFDPQAHTERGVGFPEIATGIHRALSEAKRDLGVSSKLILCFLRHLSVEKAMQTLAEAMPFRDWIAGVGLDSSERGFPPARFVSVFDKARRDGFRTVAHAGEEGPPAYIWQALALLGAERIDHGVRCVEDAALVAHLKTTRTPLTVCPLSNVRLRIFDRLRHHNLKRMLDLGLCVTVNSDDPAYFGGYIEENYLAVQAAFGLDAIDIARLARNAIAASFLTPLEKQRLSAELDACMVRYRRE